MEISLEGPLLDFLVKLVNPADPDLTQPHGPTQGVTWAVPTMGHAAPCAGEGRHGRIH